MDVIQPKYKKGGYLVRKVHVKATYGMQSRLLAIDADIYIELYRLH